MQGSRLTTALGFAAVVTLALPGGAVTANPGNGKGSSPGPAPYLSFAAESTEVALGDSVRLSWASSNTRHCFASGDWNGKFDTSGTYVTPPLDGPKSYTLECKDGGVGVTSTVAVTIAAPAAPAPDPVPTVSLSAADSQVASGGSTELSWSSQSADACTASGGWSGTKAVSGNEAVGPLEASTSYGLTCTGAGGSAMALISVAVNGVVSLSWQAPTQNADGTPLTDLAGFRIYYGQLSGNYSDRLDVASAGATTQSLTLPSGTYYFAMTALDASGNESAYSNEVTKTVN